MLRWDETGKTDFLNRQLQNNILSFYKGLSFRTLNGLWQLQKFSKNKPGLKIRTCLHLMANSQPMPFCPIWPVLANRSAAALELCI